MSRNMTSAEWTTTPALFCQCGPSEVSRYAAVANETCFNCCKKNQDGSYNQHDYVEKIITNKFLKIWPVVLWCNEWVNSWEGGVYTYWFPPGIPIQQHHALCVTFCWSSPSSQASSLSLSLSLQKQTEPFRVQKKPSINQSSVKRLSSHLTYRSAINTL